MARQYLHGYTTTEQQRLIEQARLLAPFVYKGLDFSTVTKLLEVGCGVGAQTEILLEKFEQLKVTAVDVSPEQLTLGRSRLSQAVHEGRVEFIEADATELGLVAEDHDGAFVCWFLEHVSDPVKVLKEVKSRLKPGAEVVVTEVNNSSLFIDPYSPHTLKYWYEFNDYQWSIEGHPFLGLQLGNYLSEAGFKNIEVEFRPLFFDGRDPQSRSVFLKYFFELLKSANDSLVSNKRVDPETILQVEAEFKAANDSPRGLIYYSFVRARAIC